MTAAAPERSELSFEAEDAAGFRAMLGRVLASTPLSCGQIAIKTGMPRSTAYSLPNVKRPGLPSNPDQVRDFVRACGLTPTQIDLVMDRWTALQRDIENTRTGSAAPSPEPSATATRAVPGQGCVGGGGTFFEAASALIQEAEHFRVAGEQKEQDAFGRRMRHRAPPLRRTSWIELLHYVLGDEDRTRRAIRLLIPVTVLLVALMAALVYLSVRMPIVTPFVVIGLLGPFALLAHRNLRKTKAKPAE